MGLADKEQAALELILEREALKVLRKRKRSVFNRLKIELANIDKRIDQLAQYKICEEFNCNIIDLIKITEWHEKNVKK